jgi:hypothetical protein
MLIQIIIKWQSNSARVAHDRCGSLCSDEGAAELAIALIGSYSRSYPDALVKLLALRLDGEGAEQRNELIIKNGRLLFSRLKNLQSNRLNLDCRENVISVLREDLYEVHDVSPDKVCRSSREISYENSEILKYLRKHDHLM